MELVDRLKQFLSVNSIPVTQFADNCNIPRPTVSQILNGRNKKISDEIVAKIHVAYPELSVYWLMFGEGEMIIGGANTLQTSSLAQNNLFSTPELTSSESDISHKVGERSGILDSRRDNEAGLKSKESTWATGLRGSASSPTGSVTIPTDTKRCVEKIVVFYNDNSFESFGPSKL